MEYHFATLYEALADVIGDADAVVCGTRRTSWRDFDDRAARLAAGMLEHGIAPGDRVALYLYNGPEYLETVYAALKIRAVPVNVNYRYLDEELVYLLDNAGAAVLVYDRDLGERVDRCRTRLASTPLLVEVADHEPTDAPVVAGARDFEQMVTQNSPAPRTARDEGDVLMIYTGGTTGLPKGVKLPLGASTRESLRVYAGAIGLDGSDPATVPAQVARLVAEGGQLRTLVTPPLMHGTGLSAALGTLAVGGAVLLDPQRSFRAADVLHLAAIESPTALVVVGDPFARPLLEALGADAADGEQLGTVRLVTSAGAMFSAPLKQLLLQHLDEGAMIFDILASSEAVMGVQITALGMEPETGCFLPSPGVLVLDEDDQRVEPGSGAVGIVAVASPATLGYHDDPAKTATTFRTIDGTRYAFPGDFATMNEDGTITFLGRGSNCINTGGEKVYPEEVEEALKAHTLVGDALVFGVDDERLGQHIEAIVEPTAIEAPDEAILVAYVRTHLAGYKAPKRIVVVDRVPRFDNGKPDYTAARQLAAEASGPTVLASHS